MLGSSQSVGVLDSLVIVLRVTREEIIIVRYKLVIGLLLFLWASPLPGALKDFIVRYEDSHPSEKPCSVRLSLLTVSDRSLISVELCLTSQWLVTWNSLKEELLQFLQKELLVRPRKAFGNVCHVRLLRTEEVSLPNLHHELESASS